MREIEEEEAKSEHIQNQEHMDKSLEFEQQKRNKLAIKLSSAKSNLMQTWIHSSHFKEL